MLKTLLLAVLCCSAMSPTLLADKFETKPAPEKIIAALKEGNRRFVAGESRHPHALADRRKLAAEKGQGNYAVATVLSCSDSRVPVELIFDAGIMDLFVVRVPGNVCQSDEIGGMEYGACHVYTPVLLVLGHSDCGAVTAVAGGVRHHGEGHKLERNIPSLIAPIVPVVKSVLARKAKWDDSELIDACIRENVYIEIAQLFRRSAAVRKLVKAEKIRVVGAVYDIASGKIEWLDDDRIEADFKKIDGDRDSEKKEYAD